ncbi:MAG TPA: MarR family transcriptional regulator [Polyangiaceae bacterium]|nr:MarR family transcriptional regulator [Polyangiaceae bacterium]
MSRYVPTVQEFAARVVLFHEAVAEKVGLHVTDVKVLRLLGAEALTPGQLVEHTGLTGAAVTALVDRLVERGYVTRERDEADRRRVTVRAVPAQVRKIDKVYVAYGEEMSKLLAQYSSAEFAVIEGFLKHTTELLREHTARLREQARGTGAARTGSG